MVTTAYRLQKPKYNQSTLTGEGAAKIGGRWNKKGTALVYASLSTSLTLLELRVNVEWDQIKTIPHNFVVLEIPDDLIHVFELTDLPAGWRDNPFDEATQTFLDPWLASMEKAAFVLPSAVNPQDRNILINPNHPEINRVVQKGFLPCVFDERYG